MATEWKSVFWSHAAPVSLQTCLMRLNLLGAYSMHPSSHSIPMQNFKLTAKTGSGATASVIKIQNISVDQYFPSCQNIRK